MASAVPALVLRPAHLGKHPRIRDWVEFAGDRVRLKTGKVELGQGIHCALAAIAAAELHVGRERIDVERVGTRRSPDEDYTAGSLSVTQSGAAIRAACAAARSLLLDAAASATGVPVGELVIADGAIRAGTRTLDYWSTLGPDALAREMEAVAVHGSARVDPPEDVRRHDLGAFLVGRRGFVQDIEQPGLVHGRVVRPPPPRRRLERVDETRARALPGVLGIVRNGDFLGVVAEREEVAVAAADRLRADCRWSAGELPVVDDVVRVMGGAGTPDVLVESGDFDAAAGRLVAAEYSKPYLAHASIGPSAAVAAVASDGMLEVWSHTQGVFPLRRELALVLGMPVDRIHVHHVEGSGCYGHNGAEDAALDAVLLARALPGRPVKVQWSRADEFAHEPYGPAMRARLAAKLDGSGRVVAWRHDLWSNGHNGRPGYAAAPVLLAAAEIDPPFVLAGASDPPLPAGGSQRNAVPLYDFPNRRVVRHPVAAAPLRVSALRALGAYANVHAIESFVDELAAAAGRDPLEFRLAHLTDPRARAVVESAARAAGWGTDRPAGSGLGLAFAQYKNSAAYCAVVAEVDDDAPLGVRRLHVHADAGRVVSLDGVVNQLEGGAIQAASWTLKEAVRTRDGLPPLDWDDYPILRFSEVPAVSTVVIDRPDAPSLGVGECVAGPVAAAIANAFAAAYGVRIRDLPITRERVAAAL